MRSFPFDSDVTYDELGNPEYDRGADSTILANFIHLMFADGVFPNPSTGLQVTASSETMSVIVLPGNCMIQGRMGIEENNRTLVFEASGTSYDRIDSVVARLNTNHDYRDIDLYVIKGKESSSPVVPELTRTGGIYELRLANVFIAKNTTIISPERITDTRLNTEDCGIVTSNPNPVDTTTIFKQYQAALDKYLQYVEECIDGTTAGNLQKEIDEIRNSIGVADISSIGDGTLTGGLKSLNKDLANLNTNLGDLETSVSLKTTAAIIDKQFTFSGTEASQTFNFPDVDGLYVNTMCNWGIVDSATHLVNVVWNNNNKNFTITRDGAESYKNNTGHARFLVIK